MEFEGKEIDGMTDEQIAEFAIKLWKENPDIKAEFRDLLRLHSYLNFCKQKGARYGKQ